MDISNPPGFHFNIYDERELGQSDVAGMSSIDLVDHYTLLRSSITYLILECSDEAEDRMETGESVWTFTNVQI